MNEWSVLLKVRLIEGRITTDELDRLVGFLPGTDKGFTGGDAEDFTLSFWVPAANATQAVLAGWQDLEAARARLGLGRLTAIRTHAASASQRLTGFLGVEERVGDPRAWSALLKCVPGPGRSAQDQLDVGRITRRLGPDAAVAGGAAGLVARFWVAAPDAREADRAARAALREAMAEEGLEGWTIVRAHHAVAHERAEELYRGVAVRAAREATA